VRENLKNVVLFMSSNGFLASPAEDESRQRLWLETWARVDRFLPGLKEDLALDGKSEPPQERVSTNLEAVDT